MRLYGLQQYLLLGDKQHDSKCVVAWGPGTILVVFRGTASMANIKTDMQASKPVSPRRVHACPWAGAGGQLAKLFGASSFQLAWMLPTTMKHSHPTCILPSPVG
jgi:hypothetical protein